MLGRARGQFSVLPSPVLHVLLEQRRMGILPDGGRPADATGYSGSPHGALDVVPSKKRVKEPSPWLASLTRPLAP